MSSGLNIGIQLILHTIIYDYGRNAQAELHRSGFFRSVSIVHGDTLFVLLNKLLGFANSTYGMYVGICATRCITDLPSSEI
jgi:hypothetical protein